MDQNYRFPFLYGAQYYRAPTPDRKFWKGDLEQMRESGFNAVKFWVQWRWTQRQEDQFYFDDIDELMDLAAANDLSVTLNTIFDVAPSWLFRAHPDCKMIRADGQIVEPRAVSCRQIGGYPGPCYNHPVALEHRDRFLRKTVERYASHPAMGMWDVWNEPESTFIFREPKVESLLCYCPNCHQAFAEFLEQKYGNINRLNEVWGRCYPDFTEIELPRNRGSIVDMTDWRIFQNAALKKEADFRISTVRSIDPSTPVYLHPVPNTYEYLNSVTGINDFDIVDDCDCIGATTIGFPSSSLQSVSLNPDLVTYNVECHLRAGSAAVFPRHFDCQSIANALLPQIGLGIKGFLYWQYRAEVLGEEAPGWGLLDIDGRIGPTFEGCEAFWRHLAPISEKLMQATAAPPEIAIFKSSENEIVSWSIYGSLEPLGASVNNYTRILYEDGRNIQYVTDTHLRTGLRDSIKVLVLPETYALDPQCALNLKRWVENGGHLIIEANCGMYNTTTGRIGPEFPGAGFIEAFGIREINQTGVIHLQVDSSAVSSTGIDDSMPADLQKAMNALKIQGSETVKIPLTQGGTMLGGYRYAEYEATGHEPWGGLPDRSPCMIYKPLGKGGVLAIGTLAGRVANEGNEDGLKATLRRLFTRIGLSTGEEKEVRVDKLVSSEGDAFIIQSLSSRAPEMELDFTEEMIGVFTGRSFRAYQAVQFDTQCGTELIVPARWYKKADDAAFVDERASMELQST